MKIRTLVKKIEFWTLIAVVVGGIFNYFFVTRYSAIHDAMNTKYIEIQAKRMESATLKTQDELTNTVKEVEISLHKANERLVDKTIERLDSKIEKLSQELVNTERRAKISLDIGTFVKDLQPNLQIDLEKQAEADIRDTLTLRFDIKNIGNHTAIMETPPLCLSWQPIDSSKAAKSLLSSDEDYYLENMRVGNVPSGQSVSHIFHIKLKHPPKPPFTVYYSTEFSVKTDWAIKKLASKLLGDYFSNGEIDALAQRTYSRSGYCHVISYNAENRPNIEDP